VASPLNRIPRGLLEYFGIKSGEWGPRELGQVLQPVLELRDWYTNAEALEVVATQPAGGVIGADTSANTVALTNTTPVDLVVAGNVVVPQDETWLILEAQCSWQFTAVAGQSAEYWWQFRGIGFPSALIGNVVSTATIVRTGARSLLRPFWSRPGDTIALAHGGIVVAGGTVTGFGARLRVVRFRL
jgi:hypothetical protein